MGYHRKSFPFERRFVIDSMTLGDAKHMIHGLVEVDVTEARRRVRESEVDLSWTAYIVACVARAVAENPLVHAFRSLRGDLVIFDAMYPLVDAITVKEDWGHSSNIVGVELCQLAGVKQLALFHHEPMFDDEALARILQETVRYEAIARAGTRPLKVTAAYDGLEIHL